MSMSNSAADRHEWWWMVTGFESGVPAPLGSGLRWDDDPFAAEPAPPETTIEAAFALAMRPFAALCAGVPRPGLRGVPAHSEPGGRP